MRVDGKMALVWIFLVPALLSAQASQHALRFHGTGIGPPGQQDRALLAVDDNTSGPDASTPCDVGAGSFTFEIWLRGTLAENETSSHGGDIETADYSWIEGNILLDRDIWCGSERKFGVSIAGGRVRFGTAGGDVFEGDHTIEGSVEVLDGEWHHIALTREASSGTKRIYVDGVLDFASSPGVSTADLSYPDAGVAVTPGQCSPGQLTPYGWYLVLAAEKHDAGAAYPSFSGYVDELRIWSVARSAAQIVKSYDRTVPADAPGLVGYYRFEEGTGTSLADSSAAGCPAAELVAGTAGNGEWVSRAADPGNTAPIEGGLFADSFESGDTEMWSRAVP